MKLFTLFVSSLLLISEAKAGYVTSTVLEGIPKISSSNSERVEQVLNIRVGVASKNAFMKVLSENWDSSVSKDRKEEILSLAKAEAKKRAEETLTSLLSNKGKAYTASQILNRFDTGLSAEVFNESHLFLLENGEIDLKNKAFNRSTSTAHDERLDIDLIQYADSLFKGSPEQRAENNRKRSPAPVAPKSNAFNPDNFNLRTHGDYSGNTCGVPSSNVGALRPESNGLR